MSNINDLQPTCSVVTGDFNAKNSKWCPTDKDNIPGLEIDTLTSTAGYSQIINKPTHFINNASSCIDLIFSTNTNLVTNSGVEQSLYKTCHHEIIYGEVNFKIPLPPPYYREIWDYKKADVENIQKTLYVVNWCRAFADKNINEKCRYSMKC